MERHGLRRRVPRYIRKPLLGPHASEPAGHGQHDPEQCRKAELNSGVCHCRIVQPGGHTGPANAPVGSVPKVR